MTNQQTTVISVHDLEALHTEGVGFDILRYVSLPELLGEESPTLLYFMGRKLARKFDIQTVDDVIHIFTLLGFGRLEVVKDKRKSMTFQLMSDAVASRLQASFSTDFRLEAGFLAEALHIIENRDCECVETINKRIHQVEFKVMFSVD